MIFVPRSEPPPILIKAMAPGLAKAKRYFNTPLRQRRPKSFEFDLAFPSTLIEHCLSALQKQFHGKCAYCESPVQITGGAVLDWFRPRRGVAESTGRYRDDHYWRQAFAWENMYLCCAQCNRFKGNRFPVSGQRAPADADRDALLSEQAQLIDPCKDDPEKHLLFKANGEVLGRTVRGRLTIETLGLNRKDLQERRRNAAQEFQLLISDRGQRSAAIPPLKEEDSFVALKLALARANRQLPDAERSKLEKSLSTLSPGEAAPISTAQAKRIRELQHEFDEKRTKASAARPDLLRVSAQFIESIEIRDIGILNSLSLDLSRSTSRQAPCYALLGENATGKSTVLKCIALALAGPRYRAETGVKARDLIRQGAKRGEVIVRVSGSKVPASMRMTRSTGQFKFSHESSRLFVLGYGSTRLLPRPGRRSPVRGKRASARIQNLFDPFLPLTNISSWLASVPAVHRDDVEKTLQTLLPENSEARIVWPKQKNSPVMVRIRGGAPQPFSVLSDGYQSMLGLAADIMHMMYERSRYESMRSAQGVVLIDELGNHMHPAWRMRVVKAFRKAFPQVQFIFSTHDPLCLRGLTDGEIAILETNGNKTVAIEDLPSISGMRVDQLLTSRHFGLESAVDPEMDDDLREYRALAATPATKRNSAQKARYAELSAKLMQDRLLGNTWRERLALEAASKEIDRLRTLTGKPIDGKSLDRNAVDSISKFLRRTAPTKPKRLRSKAGVVR